MTVSEIISLATLLLPIVFWAGFLTGANLLRKSECGAPLHARSRKQKSRTGKPRHLQLLRSK